MTTCCPAGSIPAANYRRRAMAYPFAELLAALAFASLCLNVLPTLLQHGVPSWLLVFMGVASLVLGAFFGNHVQQGAVWPNPSGFESHQSQCADPFPHGRRYEVLAGVIPPLAMAALWGAYLYGPWVGNALHALAWALAFWAAWIACYRFELASIPGRQG